MPFHLFETLAAHDPAASPEAPSDREVLSALQKAARDAPDEADYRLLLGRALMTQGRPAEAVSWLRDAVRLTPGNGAMLVELGRAQLAAGRRDEAAASLREAARLRLDEAEAVNALGLALLALGDADAAVSVFEGVVREQPRDARSFSNLGAALAAQGRGADAIRAFVRAVSLDPRSADARGNLAQALEAEGDGPGAIAAWRHALRLEPDAARRHLDVADALYRQGRGTEAAAAYEAALALDLSCLAGRPESQAARSELTVAAMREDARTGGRSLGALLLGPLAHAMEILARLARRRRGLDLAVSLLVAAAVVHAGVAIVRPWARHHLFLDEAVRIARLPTSDVGEVRRQVLHAVEKHGLAAHLDGERCEVRSGEGLRRIACVYEVPVEVLPGLHWPLTFRVAVDEPYMAPQAPIIF